MDIRHRELILKQFDHDINLLNNIIIVFEKTFLQVMNDLKMAFKKKEAKDFEIAAHTLKGMVSNFFYQDLVEKYFKLENMGKNKIWDGMDKKLNEVENETNKLLSELKSEFIK